MVPALPLVGSGFPFVLLIAALVLAGVLGALVGILEARLTTRSFRYESMAEIEELDQAA